MRLTGWLLNGLYLLGLAFCSPWILWSAVRHGKYREGFAAKLLGQVPRRKGDRACVWLHAVSVGEVNLLATTLAELHARGGELDVVISTTTKTGYDLARRKYAQQTVFYCPLDFSWAVRRAMRRMRPELLVLAELELWPNLIVAARKYGARVAIINGRLSDNSLRGYRRLRPLVAAVLVQLDLVAAQDQQTADRFRELGADPRSVQVTGSLKFDGAQTDRDNSKTCELRALASIALEDQVLLAGSTQHPEEADAVSIFEKLSVEFPRLRLILVPRHPQRFAEVATLLDRTGVAWQRRSMLGQPVESHTEIVPSRDQASRSVPRILLVDTVGELAAWWGAATIGLVGGTFGSRGGQNMLEPAAYGVATCFGPNTWNFRDIVAQLLAVDGAAAVRDRDELERFIRRALEDPAWSSQMGGRGRDLVLAQQGATRRTVDLLLPLLSSTAKAPNGERHAA